MKQESSLCSLTNVILICEIFHVVSYRVKYLAPNYLFYIMDNMCNLANLVKFILFADDTKKIHANSNINRLIETICCVLEFFCVWFEVNKLNGNITKTNYMLFGSRMLNKEVNIKIQNVNIERVKVTKFLGVFIDELI